MPTILVVSDLHLSDGDRVWENWRYPQQKAFEALLEAVSPDGELADDGVELIINGDCFDFLLASPGLGKSMTTDVNVAHAKWVAIAGAHERWFAALRAFLRYPTHRVTFLAGNHDLELFYPSIRARLRSAINAAPGMVRFCLTRAYQPVPDVIVEHGCQYDPWNTIPNVWDRVPLLSTPAQLETSDGRGVPVGPLQLPWGSRYFYHAFLPLKRRFPYLDMMMPLLSPVRYLALLSLLAPDLLLVTTERTRDLLADPGEPLASLTPEQRGDPATVFTASLLALQGVGNEILGALSTGAPVIETLTDEIAQMHEALQGDRVTALQTILGPHPQHNPIVETATSMLLAQLPATHYAIVGHTHFEGRWAYSPAQALLDTGTWCTRYAGPRPKELTAALEAWLADPQSMPYPGRDATRFTVAWLRTDPHIRTVGELIAWQGNTFVPVPDNALATWGAGTAPALC